MPEDMDVLIGRIKERIKILRGLKSEIISPISDIIATSRAVETAVQWGRIDAYKIVLKEIKEIKKHG